MNKFSSANGPNIQDPQNFESATTISKIDSLIEEGLNQYRDNSLLLLRTGLEALGESRRIDYKKGESKALLNLVIYHTLYGKKDTVSILARESTEIATQIDERNVVAKNHHYLGLNHQQSGRYHQALTEYTKAQDLNNALGNYAELIKQANNIAIIYRELKDYPSAIKYLEMVYDLSDKLGNEEFKAISKANQAYILLDQKKYKEAYDILDFVLPTIQKSNRLGETSCYNIMSQVLTGLGRSDESIEYANRAIKVGEELGYKEGVFNGMYAIANTHFQDNKYSEAIRIAETIIKKPNVKYETRYVHQLYNILSVSYRESGNLTKALKYQDEYLRLSEQIFNEDQQKYATRLQIEYDIKERERENQILKNQATADKKQIKNQQYIYLSTSLIALLGLGLAFLFYKTSRIGKEYSEKLELAIDKRTKELQDANAELKNSNYELERFAFIASHDLKEPLKNVISFSELIQKEVKKNPVNSRLIDYANFVEKGSRRLFDLVQSIFEFSRIDKDILDDAHEFDLEELIENLKQDYLAKANITNGEMPKITGNSSLIYTVLQNLVQNGIKYNENEVKTIHIDSAQKDNKNIITVADNGIGFNSEFREKVFDMFTRLNTKDEYEGAGLGLAICKKVMSAHRGKIWVESEEDNGSTFYLSFPS